MADQKRVFKVAEKVRAILSGHLTRVSDPRFSMVTLTSVVVSPDLRIAKVYWTVSNSADRRAEVQDAFEQNAGSLRRAVGGELGTRVVPSLKFFYDETLDTVEAVERLFQKVHEQNKARGKE